MKVGNMQKGLLLALLVTLSGCATFDVQPKPEVSQAFIQDQVQQTQFFNAEGEALPLPPEWWSAFNDENLIALIGLALSENRQLDVAEANISIARANFDRRRLDSSFFASSSASLDNRASIEPDRDFTSSARFDLNAGWEYDAFDRIASTIKDAELSVEAAEQARQDVAVIIASETALAYLDLRGAQNRLKVARGNADLQASSLDLLEDLLENGRATDLDVNRQKAQYRTTLATLPRLQAEREAAVSRLAVLTGSSASDPSESLMAIAQNFAPIPEHTGPLLTGTPEAFLRRRPDIRQAEIEIARRLTLSDIERARLFPRISFNADLFSLFNLNSQLNQFSSIGLGFGPAISWEGPDLRRVRADIAISDTETERAYAEYEQTVLQAFSDVEIALSQSANELKRRDDLLQAVDAARKALELANLRFDEGLDDFLDVLDAERTLLETEDRLEESKLQTSRLAVLTYRELAGI